VRARLWKSYWKTDRANAEHWLGLIRGVSFAQAEAMARHLVGEHWPAIVRVAEALADCGELSGAELERLVARGVVQPVSGFRSSSSLAMCSMYSRAAAARLYEPKYFLLALDLHVDAVEW
jgi:hypothetical protein